MGSLVLSPRQSLTSPDQPLSWGTMRLIILSLFAFIALPLSSRTAYGFYLSPDYHFTSEQDFRGDYNPLRIDTEYESDFATFWFRPDQLNEHNTQEKSFLTSIGSLGAKDFYVRQSLKLRAPLNEQLDFVLLHNLENDFESDVENFIVQFTAYDTNRRHGLSLIGDIGATKSENDFGAAYQYFAKSGRHYKVYYLAPQFAHNKRSYDTSRIRKQPQTYGLNFQYANSKNHIKFDLRFDQRAEWEFPDETTSFVHEATLAQLFWLRNGQGDYRHSTFLFYENKKSGNITDAVTRKRVRWSEGVRGPRYGINLWLSHHDWQRTNDHLQATYIQPEVTRYFNKWDVSLSASQGDASGSWGGEKLPSRTDWRANFSRNIMFAKSSGSARLLFTFDVDELGSSESWEGGNVQLQASF